MTREQAFSTAHRGNLRLLDDGLILPFERFDFRHCNFPSMSSPQYRTGNASIFRNERTKRRQNAWEFRQVLLADRRVRVDCESPRRQSRYGIHPEGIARCTRRPYAAAARNVHAPGESNHDKTSHVDSMRPPKRSPPAERAQPSRTSRRYVRPPRTPDRYTYPPHPTSRQAFSIIEPFYCIISHQNDAVK